MSKHPLHGRRVLVVEDEYTVASVLCAYLQECGALPVGPAASVRAARSLLNADMPVDVAILDVNLNGESVFPLADQLRALGVPLVFSSGYDRGASADRLGPAAWVMKPCSPGRLLSAAAEAIAQARH